MIVAIVLGGMVILGLLYLFIPTKVPKIETDFCQVRNEIDESLNFNELNNCHHSIDQFYGKYCDSKRGVRYTFELEQLLEERETKLLTMQLQPLLNINEPSK